MNPIFASALRLRRLSLRIVESPPRAFNVPCSWKQLTQLTMTYSSMKESLDVLRECVSLVTLKLRFSHSRRGSTFESLISESSVLLAKLHLLKFDAIYDRVPFLDCLEVPNLRSFIIGSGDEEFLSPAFVLPLPQLVVSFLSQTSQPLHCDSRRLALMTKPCLNRTSSIV
jgi:hypothetical protein